MEELTGRSVSGCRPILRGYANNKRWVLTLSDSTTLFLKKSADEHGARFLRQEHAVYTNISPSCAPNLIGWSDGPGGPLLLLEDLSSCYWPPPWSNGQIEAVIQALQRLAEEPTSDQLPLGSDTWYARRGWPEVAEKLDDFNALKICDPQWMERHIDTLVCATNWTALDGDAIVHLDVRSDNLCFRPDGSAVLVDWNLAAVGNPQFDLAFWLPSLYLEGGPPPSHILPQADPEVVTLVAGFFASRAILPPVPGMPKVRPFQRDQLTIALPWAAAVLGLPSPS